MKAPKIYRFDFSLIILVFLLVGYGLIMVFSASGADFKSPQTLLIFKKQLVAVLIGFFAAVLLAFYDYRNLKHLSIFIYGLNLLSLILVYFFGQKTFGAQRWINLGPISFQPSEFSKLFLIVFFAAYFSEIKEEVDWKHFWLSVIFFVPSLALIFFQPDLGTSLVVAVSWFAILISRGVDWKKVLVLFLLFAVIVFLLWQFSLIKEYQITRLMVFLNPDLDPKGAGYNLRQAQIAIGSGGVWGKGYLSGTQTNLKFLPVRYADFIFAVVGEELGLIGASFLLILLFLLVARVQLLSLEAKDDFGRLFCLGTAAMWLFQSVVNIGMNLGIMPITGIPLPFISAGGSAMIKDLMAVGFILSIYRRRFN